MEHGQNLSIINESRNESFIGSNKRKKTFISFAKINKFFLVPFLTPIFCSLGNFFLLKIKETKVVKNEEFILTSFILLSYVGAGCFYFISKFRQKVEGAKEKIIYKGMSLSNTQKLYNEVFKRSLLKEWILKILIAFLITIFELFALFDNKPKFHLFEQRLYFLLFIPLFSKFILKENMLRHHYFSLLIAIIGIILLFIPVCLKINLNDILPNVVNFIGSISYSLFLVLKNH